MTSPCPCGQGQDYSVCCAPLHRGNAWAGTPEQLMRSRYSAYVLGLTEYLRDSWAPETCPPDLAPDPQCKWLGLDIRAHALSDADHGTVEFVARYKINGRAFRLHETSRFERRDGRWLYLDGQFHS